MMLIFFTFFFLGISELIAEIGVKKDIHPHLIVQLQWDLFNSKRSLRVVKITRTRPFDIVVIL